MKLLKIARIPAVTIGTEATVRHAVETMVDHGAGAVVVVENRSANGIFTASDLLKRVVAKGSRLDETPIRKVMTSPPIVADGNMHPREALAIMASNHIRHLPIVDREGRVAGMLSTRHLLRNMVEELSQEIHSLDAYFCADGIGG